MIIRPTARVEHCFTNTAYGRDILMEPRRFCVGLGDIVECSGIQEEAPLVLRRSILLVVAPRCGVLSSAPRRRAYGRPQILDLKSKLALVTEALRKSEERINPCGQTRFGSHA